MDDRIYPKGPEEVAKYYKDNGCLDSKDNIIVSPSMLQQYKHMSEEQILFELLEEERNGLKNAKKSEVIMDEEIIDKHTKKEETKQKEPLIGEIKNKVSVNLKEKFKKLQSAGDKPKLDKASVKAEEKPQRQLDSSSFSSFQQVSSGESQTEEPINKKPSSFSVIDNDSYEKAESDKISNAFSSAGVAKETMKLVDEGFTGKSKSFEGKEINNKNLSQSERSGQEPDDVSIPSFQQVSSKDLSVETPDIKKQDIYNVVASEERYNRGEENRISHGLLGPESSKEKIKLQEKVLSGNVIDKSMKEEEEKHQVTYIKKPTVPSDLYLVKEKNFNSRQEEVKADLESKGTNNSKDVNHIFSLAQSNTIVIDFREKNSFRIPVEDKGNYFNKDSEDFLTNIGNKPEEKNIKEKIAAGTSSIVDRFKSIQEKIIKILEKQDEFERNNVKISETQEKQAKVFEFLMQALVNK